VGVSHGFVDGGHGTRSRAAGRCLVISIPWSRRGAAPTDDTTPVWAAVDAAMAESYEAQAEAVGALMEAQATQIEVMREEQRQAVGALMKTQATQIEVMREEQRREDAQWQRLVAELRHEVADMRCQVDVTDAHARVMEQLLAARERQAWALHAEINVLQREQLRAPQPLSTDEKEKAKTGGQASSHVACSLCWCDMRGWE
jgi:hypothetical protein